MLLLQWSVRRHGLYWLKKFHTLNFTISGKNYFHLLSFWHKWDVGSHCIKGKDTNTTLEEATRTKSTNQSWSMAVPNPGNDPTLPRAQLRESASGQIKLPKGFHSRSKNLLDPLEGLSLGNLTIIRKTGPNKVPNVVSMPPRLVKRSMVSRNLYVPQCGSPKKRP